jgi:NTP pyrophosphatase (non-canonical NTP hydrolase)
MFSVMKLLDKLMEELCEVGYAASKCKQYGMDLFYPDYGRNNDKLAQEVGDLLGVIDQLIDHSHIDRRIVDAYRRAKAKKMTAFDSNPPRTVAGISANFRHPDEYKQAEAGPENRKPMSNPRDVDSPVFKAVWNAIRKWDIGDPERYTGHMGATGSHVQQILDAVNAPQPRN